MEKQKKPPAPEKGPSPRRAYRRPELTRYQRLQELTRGDSPTGMGTPDTCAIAAHCEDNPVT